MWLWLVMKTIEAIAILGLTWSESSNKSAILKKWRLKVAIVHPDRNASENATKKTQELNEAKDVLLECLLDPLERQRQAAEEEFKARMKADIARWQEEAKEAEKKRQAAEEAKEAERQKQTAEAKREHYSLNRKKRAPGSRVHTKTSVEFIREIEEFFRLNFKESMNNKVMLSEISKMFVQSRKTPTKLQANLFRRHSKRLFLATWPNAVYSMHKNNKCFLHVGISGC